jgi:hypothetical protein
MSGEFWLRPSLLQHAIPWAQGAFSPGIKRSGSEADQSPSSNAEVNNVWSYTSTPPYGLMTWCLLTQRICLHGVELSAQGQLHLYSTFNRYVIYPHV